MTFDPNDPRLTAYVLGELGPAELPEIEAMLQSSAEARQAVEEIRRTVGWLSDEFREEQELYAATAGTNHRPLTLTLPPAPSARFGRTMFSRLAGIAALILVSFTLFMVTVKPLRRAERLEPPQVALAAPVDAASRDRHPPAGFANPPEGPAVASALAKLRASPTGPLATVAAEPAPGASRNTTSSGDGRSRLYDSVLEAKRDAARAGSAVPAVPGGATAYRKAGAIEDAAALRPSAKSRRAGVISGESDLTGRTLAGRGLSSNPGASPAPSGGVGGGMMGGQLFGDDGRAPQARRVDTGSAAPRAQGMGGGMGRNSQPIANDPAQADQNGQGQPAQGQPGQPGQGAGQPAQGQPGQPGQPGQGQPGQLGEVQLAQSGQNQLGMNQPGQNQQGVQDHEQMSQPGQSQGRRQSQLERSQPDQPGQTSSQAQAAARMMSPAPGRPPSNGAGAVQPAQGNGPAGTNQNQPMRAGNASRRL